jgi:hypothetical protein
MKSLSLPLLLALLIPTSACITGKDDGGSPIGNDAATDGPQLDTGSVGDDSGLIIEGGAPDTGTTPPVVSVIYATTNTELWVMNPSTKKVSLIGTFDNGTSTQENITDVAVNGAGDVWVCSEQHVYTAALPAGGTGTVRLTLKLTLPAASKFFALGFAPAGVLESGEGLVAGDSLGDLYYIPASSPSPTAQKLGGFGGCKTGDPAECKTGYDWEVSGDVVFYTAGGQPKGLATLRACKTGTTTCDNTNDVVAEINMAELAKKSPTALLRKQILGGGTGFGRIFGVGAWSDKVYGFTYVSGGASGTPAQLITVGTNGAGALDQSFPSLTTVGWTGAGVSTKAEITVIQ